MPKTKIERLADNLNAIYPGECDEAALVVRVFKSHFLAELLDLELCPGCDRFCDRLNGKCECATEPEDLADAKANDDRRGFND
jgi:hypothetical protein